MMFINKGDSQNGYSLINNNEEQNAVFAVIGNMIKPNPT
jgi:hypothetical protein